MKICSIVNQKGGVGKTTTTVNLACGVAKAGYRTLLVDLDPQGNATSGVGVTPTSVTHSLYNLLLQESTVAQTAIPLQRGRYRLWDVLPASPDLSGLDMELMQAPAREFRLRNILQSAASSYDFAFLDCPPSLTLLTLNALVASDSLIIPMQCEYYALEGLSALLGTLERVRAHFNAGLRVEGVLRTMYDPRNNLTLDVANQLSGYFANKLYNTVIPRNVRLAEAPSHGQSIDEYDRRSTGSRAYAAFTAEFLERRGVPASAPLEAGSPNQSQSQSRLAARQPASAITSALTSASTAAAITSASTATAITSAITSASTAAAITSAITSASTATPKPFAEVAIASHAENDAENDAENNVENNVENHAENDAENNAKARAAMNSAKINSNAHGD